MGIALEFAIESYANTPEGSLLENIKAVIAEFERVKINERTSRGRQQKVKSGNGLVHGRPPYGYRQQEQNGKSQLIIHEAEARIVRLIFNWYVLGEENSPPPRSRAITRRLHETDVPAPRHRAVSTKGWSSTSVQHILRNETYAGV